MLSRWGQVEEAGVCRSYVHARMLVHMDVPASPQKDLFFSHSKWRTYDLESAITGSAGHSGPVFMAGCPKGSFPSLAPAAGVAGHNKAICRQWMLPITHCLCLLLLELCFWSSLQQLVTAAYMCTKQLVRNVWSRLFFSPPPWKMSLDKLLPMEKLPFAWTFLEKEGMPKMLNCLWRMQISDDA